MYVWQRVLNIKMKKAMKNAIRDDKWVKKNIKLK